MMSSGVNDLFKNSLNNSVGNQSDIKDEADSDLEEIMMGDESSDADARSSIQSFKVNDLLYVSYVSL